MPYLRDEFIRAVKDNSQKAMLFLDPRSFDPEGPYDKEAAKRNREVFDQEVKTQNFPLPDGLHDQTKNIAISDALLSGGGPGSSRTPTADARDQLRVIILPVNEFYHKNILIPAMTGLPASRVNLPGEEADYAHLTGAHEARHLSQVNSSNDMLEILKRETDADQHAAQWMQATGKKDVSDAFDDLRALSLVIAPDQSHAITPYLQGTLPLDEKGMKAADSFKDRVQENVMACIATDTGIKRSDVEELYIKNPDLFYGVTRAMIDKGAFDNSHEEKVFAQSYVDAFERRVKPPETAVPQADLDTCVKPGPLLKPGR